MSFDRLGTSRQRMIPFVVSLSNHEWKCLEQPFLRTLFFRAKMLF